MGTKWQQNKPKDSSFNPVSSQIRFPDLEGQILQFWKENDIYHRTWDEGGGVIGGSKPLFTLYEGPPTANGTPGIHHVLARVFKDVIPRYKTMKGFRAQRKGGWDTHGLPVELEVEKELGISTKQEIEEYGVDRFNALCKESVMRYVKEWEELTDRIGFWVDLNDAYITFNNSYIETGWWILKQLWDQGLVYQGMKGTPHCPRCVTSLSSHEVALGYKEDTPDPSVFVKFLVSDSLENQNLDSYKMLFPRGFKRSKDIFLLAWTTTPWTLPGNTALAVKEDAQYVVADVDGERIILAGELASKVLGDNYEIVIQMKGSDLIGLTYKPPYDPIQARADIRKFNRVRSSGEKTTSRLEKVEEFHNKVVAAQFVSLEDGTGIVHVAPAFGDEDLGLGMSLGLYFLQPVDLQGIVLGNYPGSGKFVKEADEDIIVDLQERNLLFQRGVYLHTYPFCWRCNTPLLYYAKPSWYIRTTARQDRLNTANLEINWYPEHIRDGRFGEWLRNNIDWAISRERYWGTPLPIWQCSNCQHQACIGGIDELKTLVDSTHRGYLDSSDLDLHRPYIDQIAIRCEKCDGESYRVPEVMDCWYDSGAMPFAQYHYPYENKSLLDDGRFPADYICEAVDQTRGWFYSLHALSVLLQDTPSYKNVICLGLILDESGEKMSKSKGNVVEPWAVINTHGADALRWNLFTAAPPGNARRFSVNLVGESVRRFFLTLWNTYNFFVTYANIDRIRPIPGENPEAPTELDRWILSELNTLVDEVTTCLDEYNPTDAGRRIEGFVDILSTWYVRRSRRRFWKSEDDSDKRSAYQTLYNCLVTIAHLVAPFTPFLAEELYQNLVRSLDTKAPESVHLDSFPLCDQSLVDLELVRTTHLVMRIARLGRSARSKAQMKIRQPLGKLQIKVRSQEEAELLVNSIGYILEELNVKILNGEIVWSDEHITHWFEYKVRPNLGLLGGKYGAGVKEIAQNLEASDPTVIAGKIRSDSKILVGDIELLPEEVSVSQSDKEGWVSAFEGGYGIRLAIDVTSELFQEGLARELIHRIQNIRRNAGFNIEDRIVTFYQASESVR